VRSTHRSFFVELLRRFTVHPAASCLFPCFCARESHGCDEGYMGWEPWLVTGAGAAPYKDRKDVGCGFRTFAPADQHRPTW